MLMRRRGFSLVELLVVIATAAILLSLLLPALVSARDISRKTLCASNLRQIGVAWLSYTSDYATYPASDHEQLSPDWAYGGVAGRATADGYVLDPDRPINPYLHSEDPGATALIFRCPSDKGVFESRRARIKGDQSILAGETCFEEFGTSYRANPELVDVRETNAMGIESRPLRIAEVEVSPSTLLSIGDAAWYYGSREPGDADHGLDASWHKSDHAGNFLAADGSVRWFDLSKNQRSFRIQPVIRR